jgi:hypothetical protein
MCGFRERQSAKSAKRGPRRTLAELVEDVSAVSAPMGELIVEVPPPGGDHPKNKPPTLIEQDLIDIRIQGPCLGRDVRNIEFDRPTATGLEVDEERATVCSEEVAWVRFAMQQLLGRPVRTDCLAGAVQCAEEQLPVALSKRGGLGSVRDQPLSRCDSFHEVWCLDLEAAHPRMQSVKRVCVVGW